jgi:hypothetical protein
MKRFNMRAGPFARLTWNARRHRALIVVLSEIERQASREFMGGDPEYIQPTSTEASLWPSEQIPIDRDRWIRNSYEQIAQPGKEAATYNLRGAQIWGS